MLWKKRGLNAVSENMYIVLPYIKNIYRGWENLSFSSLGKKIISSPEHRVLSELLWSLFVCPCTSVHNFLINTLASTNINQSTPNLVKMYMTIRSRMRSIMELIGPELFEISALNPFPNKPWFLRVCSTSLLKTLWEKEKLLVTSNFSFSHSVFYPFEEPSSIFIKFENIVW